MLKRLSFLLLAGAALASPAGGHDLGSIGGSSSFRDDIWTGGAPQGAKTFLQPLSAGLRGCGLGPCPRTFRVNELLTSTAADASANTRTDITGHAVSVSGLIITVSVEASGSFTASVGGEQTLDEVGEHSWEWLGGAASPNAKWLPVGSYRFETSSPVEAERAVPELPTWALIGLGFATLGCAARGRRAPGRIAALASREDAPRRLARRSE